MRRGVVVAFVAAVWAPAAHACPVQTSPVAGPAPLEVTYTATCASAAYSWSFADGGTAEGSTVTHVFAAGRFGGTLATDGEETALPQATAVGFTLHAPPAADWHAPVVFTGTVAPAGRVRLYRGDSFVASTRGSTFRLHVRLNGPGPYTLRSAGVVSAPVTVRVRPTLETHLVGTPAVGRPLTLVARLRPARAGTLQVRVGKTVRRGSSIRLRLDTRRPRSLRVSVRSLPADGYAAAKQALRVSVVYPELVPGSTGASVHELERRLAELHYALLGVDSTYGEDTADAVTAFEKVEGLPRTGDVDAAVWARLAKAVTPKARYAGAVHVEVDKTRQVLFVVRGGKVDLIVPVSTAGIAGYYTPEGRFAVYRKVVGLDDGPLGPLYDPNYFVGGYAIHGSPSVPPYPASHGCVRVPMWISKRMYATIPYGELVYVY
ncbi:MAG TPA: L,D-transpeptidase family protein [Gaiellaceae bacterium]|nr:L,D-transpeptidase family protein [Gaiellaceae bacterium]